MGVDPGLAFSEGRTEFFVCRAQCGHAAWRPLQESVLIRQLLLWLCFCFLGVLGSPELLCLQLGIFSLFALLGFWKAFSLFKCGRCCILPCPNVGKWLNTVANSWSLVRNAFFGACRKCHPKSLNCDGRWCLLAERVRDVDNRWCPCQWHGVVVASFLCPYQGCCFSLWSAQEDVTAHHVLFTFFFP